VIVWELIQGVGALVGLATGLFVLWERMTKHSPNIFVRSEPFLGGQRYLSVRIENRSDRPIFVEAQNGVENGELRVAIDNSIEAIVTSLLPGTSTFLVDGKETKDFPLLKGPDFSEMDPVNECTLSIRWRFAQPILLRAWRRRTISISKQSLQILEGEFED